MAEDPSVPVGTADARFALDQSELAVREALRAFEVLKRRIRDSEEDVAPKEVQGLLSQLARARLQLADEVVKHEERALRKAGLLADAPIDLDAMRASIGGKLDRLRTNGAAGGVSGQPDG